jgi:hypothetical protein
MVVSALLQLLLSLSFLVGGISFSFYILVALPPPPQLLQRGQSGAGEGGANTITACIEYMFHHSTLKNLEFYKNSCSDLQ